MSADTTPGQTTAPVVIQGVSGLRDRLGTELGTSDWVTIRQEDITTFARLTGDEQWIHVDPERAASGPFGATIQHGFLTLGLATGLLWSVCVVEGFGVILNYGLNKVRFPAPVPVGSRVRATVRLASLEDIPGGAQITMKLTFEVEGGEKPACVAETVARVYEG